MDLVVFDLDGTLLNGASQVSEHTRDTLAGLRERGIAYTVATGRTPPANRPSATARPRSATTCGSVL